METISKVKNTTARPERVLQFGEGNFLRAFFDWQVDLLNEKTDFNGNVVLVQPLKRGMGEMINAQKGLYTPIRKAIREGVPFKQYRTIDCTHSCLNLYEAKEFGLDQFLADVLICISSSPTPQKQAERLSLVIPEEGTWGETGFDKNK